MGRAVLEVLNPEGTATLRVLVDQVLSRGFNTVVWDGRDANGTFLDDGLYPCRLIVRDLAGNIMFQDTKAASLTCLVSAPAGTWTAVKSLYRSAD